MLNTKKLMLVIAASLLSVTAFASEGNGPTTPQPTDTTVNHDVDFSCHFEGGGSSKSTWISRCKADGSFDRDDAMIEGQRNHMTLRCDNGDGTDMVTVFDGTIKTRRVDDSLVIRGIDQDHDGDDDSCSAPVIVITFGDRDNDGDHGLSSQLSYSSGGFSYTIPGLCQLDN